MWHSLEHMADPLELLTTLHKMLAPGGVLIVSVPDASGPQARLFGSNWFHLDVPRHVRHFTAQSLELLYSKAGFDRERRWPGEWEYDVCGWVQSGLNCIFRRKNVLFRSVTGRRPGAGKMTLALSYVLGGFCCSARCYFPGAEHWFSPVRKGLTLAQTKVRATPLKAAYANGQGRSPDLLALSRLPSIAPIERPLAAMARIM
jgi:hypothetical protein